MVEQRNSARWTVLFMANAVLSKTSVEPVFLLIEQTRLRHSGGDVSGNLGGGPQAAH